LINPKNPVYLGVEAASAIQYHPDWLPDARAAGAHHPAGAARAVAVASRLRSDETDRERHPLHRLGKRAVHRDGAGAPQQMDTEVDKAMAQAKLMDAQTKRNELMLKHNEEGQLVPPKQGGGGGGPGNGTGDQRGWDYR
jgi:hypothetical protein